jgi:hypothetical protein
MIAGGEVTKFVSMPRAGNVWRPNGVEQSWEIVDGKKGQSTPNPDATARPRRRIEQGLNAHFSERLFKRS